MDEKRIAEVFVPVSPGSRTGKSGSGYLICNNLVLTSFHVMGKVNQPCRIRLLSDRPDPVWIEAVTIWGDADLDAALVAPAQSDIPFGDKVFPVVLGELSGQEPVAVDGVGFPRAMKIGTRSDTLPVTGSCHPMATARSGRMLIKLTWVTPVDRKKWAGVSGTVVFAGDVPVGVIKAVPEHFDSDVLEAVPMTSLVAEAGFKNRVERSGISPQMRIVDARYAGNLQPGGWESVHRRYAESVKRTFCRFEFSGLGIDGATARVLEPNQVFSGLRFQPGNATHRPMGLGELGKKKAAVILGPPGCGKSGTLKLLLHDAMADPAILPIYIPLARMAGNGPVTQSAFVRFLVDQASELGVPSATARFFTTFLGQGRCVVALDALDELGDRTRRSETVLALGHFCDNLSLNRFYLTSRPGPYGETPLPETSTQFNVVSIQPFSETDISLFLKICFQDDGRLAARITGRPDLRGLANNPLHASLLALQAADGDLPVDRFELFDRLVQTSIGAWEQRKIGRDIPEAKTGQRRNALERIAWKLQKTAGEGAVLVEDAAVDTVARSLDPGCDRSVAVEMLHWLARRTGILKSAVQHGRRQKRVVYSFGHQQIQEFLVGCELARRIKHSFSVSFSAMEDKWFNGDWREILRFTIARLSSLGQGDLHQKFLRAVLDLDDPFEDLLHRKIFMVADLMAYCDFMSEDFEQAVVDKLAAVVKDDPCLCRDAFELLLPLADLQAVHGILLPVASGAKESKAMCHTSLTRDPATATDLRLDALAALSPVLEKSDARKLLGRAEIHFTDEQTRIVLSRIWYGMGEIHNAHGIILDILKAQGNSPDYTLLDELWGQGGNKESVERAKHALDRSRETWNRWVYAMWLLEHGVLEPESPVFTDLFERARLSLGPAEQDRYDAPEEAGAALNHIVDVLKHGTNRAALDFARDAVHHEALGFRLAPLVPWFDDQFGQSILDELARIAKEDPDNSRRNGIVYHIVTDLDDRHAVSVLLDLLGAPKPLLWSGTQIVSALLDRGRGAEAEAKLTAVVNDPGFSFPLRIHALSLLEEVNPAGHSGQIQDMFTEKSPDQLASWLVAEFNDWPGLPLSLLVSLARDPFGRRVVEEIKDYAADALSTEQSGQWEIGWRLHGPDKVTPLADRAAKALLYTLPWAAALDEVSSGSYPQGVLYSLCTHLLGQRQYQAARAVVALMPSAYQDRVNLEIAQLMATGNQQAHALPFAKQLFSSDRSGMPQKLAAAKVLDQAGEPVDSKMAESIGNQFLEYMNNATDREAMDTGINLVEWYRDRKDTQSALKTAGLLLTHTDDMDLSVDLLIRLQSLFSEDSNWIARMAEAARAPETSQTARCRLVDQLKIVLGPGKLLP